MNKLHKYLSARIIRPRHRRGLERQNDCQDSTTAFPNHHNCFCRLSRILSNKRHTVSAISETQLFISDKKAGIDRPLQIIIGNIYLGKVNSWTELDVHWPSLSRAGAVCREIEAYRGQTQYIRYVRPTWWL